MFKHYSILTLIHYILRWEIECESVVGHLSHLYTHTTQAHVDNPSVARVRSTFPGRQQKSACSTPKYLVVCPTRYGTISGKV